MADQPETEYLDGVAHPKVSPKLSHGAVQRILSGIIADLAGDRGIVATELRCHLGSADGGKPRESGCAQNRGVRRNGRARIRTG